MPIAVELRARVAHRLEQVGGAWNSPAGSVGVAGGHEQLADARRREPGEQLLQVRAVAHEPRGEVRHDRVAGGREPLGQLERGLEPFRGEAVTVTLVSVARCSSTCSSMPSSGSSSKRELRRRSARRAAPAAAVAERGGQRDAVHR